MAETNIGAAVASDLKNAIRDYSVASQTLDRAGASQETRWINKDWSKWYGYYKAIPELTAAIDAKATWTIGKGFTSDEVTEMILEAIRGWGKDTFNTILENLVRTYHINGDAYAEIITDDDDILINLKPLDPGTMVNITNKKGKLIRYDQITVNGIKEFPVEKIFHLARNRVGDEIHGVSLIEALENVILARNEAMSDWKRVLHRNVDPLWIFHLDTDDETQIAKFKSKQDAARGKGENMYIPKGAVMPELVSIATNATLNPLSWIQGLNQYFFQAVGVPDIILGSSTNLTEASAKIAYLAFQQTIEEEQLFIEEQVLQQLNLSINLEFPASLANEMLSDKPKVEGNEIESETEATEPNDTKVEMEGRK
jgi:hypothetical protein